MKATSSGSLWVNWIHYSLHFQYFSRLKDLDFGILWLRHWLTFNWKQNLSQNESDISNNMNSPTVVSKLIIISFMPLLNSTAFGDRLTNALFISSLALNCGEQIIISQFHTQLWHFQDCWQFLFNILMISNQHETFKLFIFLYSKACKLNVLINSVAICGLYLSILL